MTNEERYRLDWMTDDQWDCYELLGDVHCGLNHVFGKVHKWGEGIKLNSTCSNSLATFDFDGLTHLVVLAHDRMIRVEITPSGPGMIGFVCSKRNTREGRMHERHPSIEEAITRIRN